MIRVPLTTNLWDLQADWPYLIYYGQFTHIYKDEEKMANKDGLCP